MEKSRALALAVLMMSVANRPCLAAESGAAISGFTIYPVENFTYIILPTTAYNLLFIWPIYWLVRRIRRRSTREQHVISS